MTLRRPRNCNHVPIGWFDSNPTPQGEEYRTMMDKFIRLGLIRSGERTYAFTNIGYKRADRFWRIFVLNRLAALQKGTSACVDAHALAAASSLTNGQEEANELLRHLRILEQSGFVECAEDLASVGALITPEGLAEVRNHPEMNFATVE